MENKKVAKKSTEQVTYSLGTIEIAIFIVLFFALAFFLLGCAWLISIGFWAGWDSAKSGLTIVGSGVVIYFCIRALWWLFKHQRAKQEKSPTKSTSVVKRQSQPMAKKGK